MDFIELWTEEVCDDPDCRWIEPKNHRHVPYPPSLTGTGLSLATERRRTDMGDKPHDVTHSHPYGYRPECRGCNPSPARDDAEKAIAGLLAQHRFRRHTGVQQRDGSVRKQPQGCECWRWEGDEKGHRAHVASVIAAHMAAPDELTVLREQLTALRVAVIELATKHGIESDDLYATLGAGDA